MLYCKNCKYCVPVIYKNKKVVWECKLHNNSCGFERSPLGICKEEAAFYKYSFWKTILNNLVIY
jgi:hypothetical protein